MKRLWLYFIKLKMVFKVYWRPEKHKQNHSIIKLLFDIFIQLKFYISLKFLRYIIFFRSLHNYTFCLSFLNSSLYFYILFPFLYFYNYLHSSYYFKYYSCHILPSLDLFLDVFCITLQVKLSYFLGFSNVQKL